MRAYNTRHVHKLYSRCKFVYKARGEYTRYRALKFKHLTRLCVIARKRVYTQHTKSESTFYDPQNLTIMFMDINFRVNAARITSHRMISHT